MESAIGRCRLEGVRHQTIETLSKGYKQRVGMAQALTLLDIYLDKRHAARQEKPVTPQVALTVI